MAVNTRKPKAGPLDEPVTESTIDFYTNALAKLRPDLSPELLRKYTIFYLSGKDVSDLTNENLGFINSVLNPGAFVAPNLANKKVTDDYFYGVVGPTTYKELYDQAFQTSAPNWVATEKEVRGIPKTSYSFRRGVLESIKNGESLQSIIQGIREENIKLTTDPNYMKVLKANGLSTPFDNLTSSDAENFVKTMFSDYNQARNTFNTQQASYLKSDPYFSRGLPDPSFQYGLQTDYRRGTVKHPLADVIKIEAENTADAIVQANYPGVAPEILKPTDVPERMGTARTKIKTQFGSLKGQEVNPRQLRTEAFKVAANRFLNVAQKDAAGNVKVDTTTNQPKKITPLEDALAGRLIVGTNVR